MSEKTTTMITDTLSTGASHPLRWALLLVLGNLLLIASTRLQVPFWPVPVTMETFAVLTIGTFYSRRLALATVGAFLLEGLAGLPVFAHGGGPAYLLGPTGGYLLGYAAAVFILAQFRLRGWLTPGWRLLLALAIADASIFALGFSWLAVLIGPGRAWFAGVAPFLLSDALKIGLVAASAGLGKRWLNRRID